MSGGGSHAESRSPARRFAEAPGPLVLVAVGVGYLTLAQLVMALPDPDRHGPILWPAAGLALAALLLLPTDRWVWALGAVALAEIGGDLAWGLPVGASIGWAFGNTAQALVGALLLRRLGNPDGTLVPVRQLLLFLSLGVVAAPECMRVGSNAPGFGAFWTMSFSDGAPSFVMCCSDQL